MIADALALALSEAGVVLPHSRIPTMNELTRRTRATARDFPDLVQVRTVGHSRAGEPIEMLSIGSGPKSALLIGAPHPNEPIGCMTIEHLIERLCASPALRAALPYRWHFIKAIEPDALRLNEGWFDRPGDLEHYLKHFFRPALADQAEYGFPFDPALNIPVSATPENDAWRTAFELTRPDLLYSLHNADYGGAFYILSRDEPALAEALSKQPKQLGLTLNDIGESLDSVPTFASGVYAPFDVVALAEVPEAKWSGGDSSASYAARHSSFELIAEVSFWEARKNTSQCTSNESKTRANLIRQRNAWNADIVHLGQPVLDAATRHGDVFYNLLLRTVKETLDNAGASEITASDEIILDKRAYELHWVSIRLISLRKVALIWRLKLMLDLDVSASRGAELAMYLTKAASLLNADFNFRSVPLHTLITAQIHAGLTTAAYLST